jgi:isoaspartyl peptidase/L-asparaginase-like protein (Ntn-hydrolase superfamily)
MMMSLKELLILMPHDTVNTVALDEHGATYAAICTGGRANELVSRTRDTPHICKSHWFKTAQ